MITARRMRHSVDVAVVTEALSDRGQTLKGLPLIVSAKEPCEIENLSGREIEQARQMYAVATHRVRMRFNHQVPITTKHILLFGNQKLNVGYVNNVENRDREVILLCAEAAE